MRSTLDDVAHGTRVVLPRTEEEATPTAAAAILGVTRQFVDRLCEDGILAFRRLPGSRHRRIRVQDILDVVTEREQRRTGGDALSAAISAPEASSAAGLNRRYGPSTRSTSVQAKSSPLKSSGSPVAEESA